MACSLHDGREVVNGEAGSPIDRPPFSRPRTGRRCSRPWTSLRLSRAPPPRSRAPPPGSRAPPPRSFADKRGPKLELRHEENDGLESPTSHLSNRSTRIGQARLIFDPGFEEDGFLVGEDEVIG